MTMDNLINYFTIIISILGGIAFIFFFANFIFISFYKDYTKKIDLYLEIDKTNLKRDNISSNLGLKRIFDIIASFFILFMWCPAFLVLSIIIKSTSKGPVISKSERIGLKGNIFYLYKFRTTYRENEPNIQITNTKAELSKRERKSTKSKDDILITPIGKFLRKTGLDELPQFYNVLRGDMSLVGPSPKKISEIKNLGSFENELFSIKPGITSTFYLEHNKDKISFEEWLKMDIQYIQRRNLFIDIKIFFATIIKYLALWSTVDSNKNPKKTVVTH
jgi:lipopolysaccharide/colanic/teichoic acid biosynthesis glycosyltransferase